MITLWFICAVVNTAFAWYDQWDSSEFASEALIGWVCGPIKTIMYVLQFLHYHFK